MLVGNVNLFQEPPKLNLNLSQLCDNCRKLEMKRMYFPTFKFCKGLFRNVCNNYVHSHASNVSMSCINTRKQIWYLSTIWI